MPELAGRPVVGFSEKLGRLIRQDDPSTLGTSTQTLAEEAIREGRTEDGITLVAYFRQEMQTMHNIMMVWIKDILRQLLAREGLTTLDLPTALVRPFETMELGTALQRQVGAAIRSGQGPLAEDLLDRLRLEYKNVHDLLVAWVQDLLTAVAEKAGEEAVFDCIAETYERIWMPRYAKWDEMTPEEKLQLTVEGMRGGHFSGPRRRGDVKIEDKGNRYVVSFDPCGSGGVLRRGDPETGRGPYPTTGVNRVPHPWTWGKTGVHWYCVHCCITAEVLPLRRTGRPLRPLDHNLDPQAPSVWNIYKDPVRTAARHYERVGVAPPADAPREED